jgi:hypothetical protein
MAKRKSDEPIFFEQPKKYQALSPYEIILLRNHGFVDCFVDLRGLPEPNNPAVEDAKMVEKHACEEAANPEAVKMAEKRANEEASEPAAVDEPMREATPSLDQLELTQQDLEALGWNEDFENHWETILSDGWDVVQEMQQEPGSSKFQH